MTLRLTLNEYGNIAYWVQRYRGGNFQVQATAISAYIAETDILVLLGGNDPYGSQQVQQLMQRAHHYTNTGRGNKDQWSEIQYIVSKFYNERSTLLRMPTSKGWTPPQHYVPFLFQGVETHRHLHAPFNSVNRRRGGEIDIVHIGQILGAPQHRIGPVMIERVERTETSMATCYRNLKRDAKRSYAGGDMWCLLHDGKMSIAFAYFKGWDQDDENNRSIVPFGLVPFLPQSYAGNPADVMSKVTMGNRRPNWSDKTTIEGREEEGDFRCFAIMTGTPSVHMVERLNLNGFPFDCGFY